MDGSAQPQFPLRCDACGYDFTGLKECRCPECGKVYTPKKLRVLNEWRHVRPRRVIGGLAITPLSSCLLILVSTITLDTTVGGAITVSVLIIAFFFNVFVTIDASDKLTRYFASPDTHGIGSEPATLMRIFVWFILMFLTMVALVIGVIPSLFFIF